MEYTSKGVGNAALATGIIGTSLGALSSAGGIAGLLGLGTRNNSTQDTDDRPVTRYEMSLMQAIADKNNEITLLKAAQYTDSKDDIIQAQLNQQAVWAATATANFANLTQQLQQLYGLTKPMIPYANIVPEAATASSNG